MHRPFAAMTNISDTPQQPLIKQLFKKICMMLLQRTKLAMADTFGDMLSDIPQPALAQRYSCEQKAGLGAKIMR